MGSPAHVAEKQYSMLSSVAITKTLIKEFDYPVLGPGMMWQRFAEAVESFGTRVYLNTRVLSLERDGCHIRGYSSGQLVPISGEAFHKQHAHNRTHQPTRPAASDVLQAAQNSIIGISNRWR